METILGIFAGLGVGSILTTIIQFCFKTKSEKRERLYQEKKKSYIGLLNALHTAAVAPSERHAKEYALWQMRCDLVGSEEVIKAAADIAETLPGTKERHKFFEMLISSMRKDLLNVI